MKYNIIIYEEIKRYLNEEIKRYLNEASIASFKFEDIVNDEYYNYLDSIDSLYRYEENYKYENDLESVEDENDFKEYVLEDLYGEYVDFISEMEYIISNNNGYIPIFREITVNDDWLIHLKTSGKRLGIYWTWEEEMAEAHCGDYSKKNIALICSKIKEEYVDWEETIKLNLDPVLGHSEKEIRLFKNTKLYIDKLYTNNEEQDISEIKDKIFYA